jgi:hypothetical protein
MKPMRVALAFMPLVFGLAGNYGSCAQSAGTERLEKAAADSQALPGLAGVAPGTVFSTYAAGKLTLRARGAPLIDVLYSACGLLGAELTVPDDADQPIMRAVGPGDPRTVIDDLLRGTDFGYSITFSPKDPNVVANLTVFPKSAQKDKEGKDPDPSPVSQRLRELITQAQSELASGGTDYGTEGAPASSGDNSTGSADTGSPRPEDYFKVLESDPRLLSGLDALATSGADGNADTGGTPNLDDKSQAPPSPGVVHRHHHR